MSSTNHKSSLNVFRSKNKLENENQVKTSTLKPWTAGARRIEEMGDFIIALIFFHQMAYHDSVD